MGGELAIGEVLSIEITKYNFGLDPFQGEPKVVTEIRFSTNNGSFMVVCKDDVRPELAKALMGSVIK
jgi:hypothetical protein